MGLVLTWLVGWWLLVGESVEDMLLGWWLMIDGSVENLLVGWWSVFGGLVEDLLVGRWVDGGTADGLVVGRPKYDGGWWFCNMFLFWWSLSNFERLLSCLLKFV